MSTTSMTHVHHVHIHHGRHALETVEEVAWLRGTGRSCVNLTCGLREVVKNGLFTVRETRTV